MKEKIIPSASGHRQRVKDRFLAEGIDHFDESHVLELLLFYAVPRIDTKPLAKALIARFGSFSQVLEATHEDLMKVDGIGEQAATFLNLIHAVGRYYLMNRDSKSRVLGTTDACGQFLIPYFHGLRNEVVYLLCLDAKCKVLCCQQVGEGSVNSANISTRRIMEIALGVNATSVILAHNHPSGLAIPSGDDVSTTQRIADALIVADIILADHFVVAGDDYVSLLQSGSYVPGR